jgi:hypothetical protein
MTKQVDRCWDCAGPIPPDRLGKTRFCSEECKAHHWWEMSESIVCTDCWAEAYGVEDANAAGWQDVHEDPDGYAWSHIGTCPDCCQVAVA